MKEMGSDLLHFSSEGSLQKGIIDDDTIRKVATNLLLI